ncbi:hypothetical protein TSTA_126390 [Talaromyces stipitatus ATCC 10500]|uniref:Integrase catalytic domain-containing protein n=1 Tax=Talaromyces stipitatus (strain ATCC 10500 / CBS 375.48 / QM 6759 / NRRL 1006) TaxID=441959 RepID=B8MCM9_TALSN|nr:uncharacterized protein TSTA_126390 [Talaromyces stipitatus ATCC 10500]EED18931.1 hypothetical protein TSTA_126390 [Talaromyces stipitatus ATCC 10500]
MGAARVSTVGRRQLTALQKIYPGIMVDKSRAGEHSIRFGQGDSVDSEGAVTIKTPIGDVDFYVINILTPFLLCIADIDRHEAYLDNTTNCLVKGDLRVLIVWKWGHPWFFLDDSHTPVTHDNVNHKSLAEIEKYCHHYQMNQQAPRRFKFTLTDDCEFNYEIVVDIMYLDGKPVLHVVDWATSFQAARFLKSLSAKDTWEALRAAWIDTYLGPPDVISHDTGTNFASNEFKMEARMMGITCHQVLVEAHSSIGKVERYHAPLCRAFNIISTELGTSVDKDVVLQMAVKAINDTMGPDRIVPTMLVFGAYPRMMLDSPPSALTIRRAQATRKAMAELRKAVAKRRVNDALNTRNGPIITETLNLPPGANIKNKQKADVNVYLSKKEKDDLELALKLRREGKIVTEDAPFELSSVAEIDGLIANGTFKIVHRDDVNLRDLRIFNSRLVNEIKGKNEILYEKSRLAKTKLQRIIIANLPKEMRSKYPPDLLLLVEGALYGIPEAGVHWFSTYHEHHKVKMDMETSMYNPCLLVTKPGAESFSLVGMQTDDTLIIATEKFARGYFFGIQWRKDYFRIGFVIAMVNEDFSKEGHFIATGNIIHWASSKCKRVTRSVLASEIYGLTTRFDHGITLASTIKMITDRLNLPTIPVVVCTDSYSLYKCLVKLGTTKEKRLIIDLMALRQSYEKWEIDEIRWIHGDDNPADAFTKANPNGALRDFIDKNKLTIRVEGFVERTKQD